MPSKLATNCLLLLTGGHASLLPHLYSPFSKVISKVASSIFASYLLSGLISPLLTALFAITDPLQQLQPSVNGARKLVALVFEGRPIQKEMKKDRLPSAPSSAMVPPVGNDSVKHKVGYLLQMHAMIMRYLVTLIFVIDFSTFKETETSRASFSTASLQPQVGGIS